MRGITKAELEELKILEQSADGCGDAEFDPGDPCEDTLNALVQQGRVTYSPPDGDYDGTWTITDQGLLALEIWASIDHEKFFAGSS